MDGLAALVWSHFEAGREALGRLYTYSAQYKAGTRAIQVRSVEITDRAYPNETGGFVDTKPEDADWSVEATLRVDQNPHGTIMICCTIADVRLTLFEKLTKQKYQFKVDSTHAFCVSLLPA